MNAITFEGNYVVPAGKVLIVTGYISYSDTSHWWPVGSTLPAGSRPTVAGTATGAVVGCGILKNATT